VVLILTFVFHIAVAGMLQDDTSILRYFTDAWTGDATQFGQCTVLETVLVQVKTKPRKETEVGNEEVEDSMEVDDASPSTEGADDSDSVARGPACYFRVAWVGGQDEACTIARDTRDEGFLPIAAVAIPVVDEAGQLTAISDCPEGKKPNAEPHSYSLSKSFYQNMYHLLHDVHASRLSTVSRIICCQQKLIFTPSLYSVSC
jgi:hypothetical protein